MAATLHFAPLRWQSLLTLPCCSSQDFSAVLELPPGTHRLKFIVDDEWKCSNDLEAATDPDGNLVNYIEVDDGLDDDFDEFGERRSSLEDSSNGRH
jgi:5'-AMP-activated protein kinase regulatory beta subunit